MAQPVFITRSGKSKRLCAPRLSVRKLAKQPLHTPFPSGYQVPGTQRAGVELAGSVIQTGIFQALADTFNCSRPFAIASPSRKTEKLAAYILAVLYGSPPDLHRYGCVPAVQAIQRRFYIRLAGIARAPCSAIDSCRCRPAARPKTPGPAASCRQDG